MRGLWEFIIVRCLKLRKPNFKLHTYFRVWPIGTKYTDSGGRILRYVRKVK